MMPYGAGPLGWLWLLAGLGLIAGIALIVVWAAQRGARGSGDEAIRTLEVRFARGEHRPRRQHPRRLSRWRLCRARLRCVRVGPPPRRHHRARSTPVGLRPGRARPRCISRPTTPRWPSCPTKPTLRAGRRIPGRAAGRTTAGDGALRQLHPDAALASVTPGPAPSPYARAARRPLATAINSAVSCTVTAIAIVNSPAAAPGMRTARSASENAMFWREISLAFRPIRRA